MNRIIPLGGDALRQTAEKQEGTTISPDTEKDNLNSPDRKSPLQSILKNKFKGFLLNKTTPEEETIQSSTQRLRVDDTVAIGNSTDAENHAKGYTSGLKLPGMEETPSNKEHMLTPNSNAENKKGGLFTLIKKNLPDLSKNNQLKTNLMKQKTIVEAIIQHNTTSAERKRWMIYPDMAFKVVWDNALLM